MSSEICPDTEDSYLNTSDSYAAEHMLIFLILLGIYVVTNIILFILMLQPGTVDENKYDQLHDYIDRDR